MDYITPSKQPMGRDPYRFRVMGGAWYEPHENDRFQSPVYVVFTIVENERRAFAVARMPHGRLFCREYHEEMDSDGRGPFAMRIDYGEPGDDPADDFINIIGDPLDAWIVGGMLPDVLLNGGKERNEEGGER